MRFALRYGIAATVLITLLAPLHAVAAASTPTQAAEAIRSNLLRAQLVLHDNPDEARRMVSESRVLYSDTLAEALTSIAPHAGARVQAGFVQLDRAISEVNVPSFAAARAQIWTSLLAGSTHIVEAALLKGDARTAQLWLPLREFRHATRFSRPNADATLAIRNAVNDESTASAALQSTRADLFDTYQARLTEALHDLLVVDTQGFAARRTEEAALAEGYFIILAPAYREQRGDAAVDAALQTFVALRATALEGKQLTSALSDVEGYLKGFRAAPLSAREQTRRAGQLLRFLALVPIEYGRGVRNGVVSIDLEIREAITFRDGAAAAFDDLRSLLESRDAIKTNQAAELFAALERQLSEAGAGTQVADPQMVQSNTDQLNALLADIMPAEWQQHDSAADFDVIQTALDQLDAAIVSGQYELAESARLEAYAIFEFGPEVRLAVFAPEYKVSLEEMFWYGQGEHKGLAYLISQNAPAMEIRLTRTAINAKLAAAQKALVANNSPEATTINAAIIVLREGLEAVLILAALMGSLKTSEARRYRRPMWWGVGIALIASLLTWGLAQGVLSSLSRYGEKLEAIVSLIAIAVLLLITNWFFHQVYWTDRIASFHVQKRRLLSGDAGKWIGLALLGFSSVYREGFETVLFLQALVLESGVGVVLVGVVIGLIATLGIGVILFKLQVRLPYKRMLIFTGVMIGVVLLAMVGHTVHIMQVVGWMPIHPIRSLLLPAWMGLWFGVYATIEGLMLQFIAGAFVIGSYFLAERLQKRRIPPRVSSTRTNLPSEPETSNPSNTTTLIISHREDKYAS